MGLIERSEWESWARAWGLTHEPQRGKFIRNEGLVGSYKGYLLRVGWGGDYGASLVVLVRFPKPSQNLKVLREQLLRSPVLSTIPGWKGRAGGVRLEPSSLVWAHPFSFRRPKAAEIQEWIDRILQRLPELIKPFSGQCEQCGASGVERYVLVERVPTYLCGNCQGHLVSEGDMRQRRYEQTEANYLTGLLYGAGGSVVGGITWALLAIATKRIYAAVAIGIAWLVAWAYVKGAKKIDGLGKLIGAVLTMGGVAVGDVMFYAYTVHAVRPEIPFDLGIGWRVFLKVLTTSPRELAGEIMFGLVGVWYVFRYLEQPKFKPKIEQGK